MIKFELLKQYHKHCVFPISQRCNQKLQKSMSLPKLKMKWIKQNGIQTRRHELWKIHLES